jgi:hypothetical protein
MSTKKVIVVLSALLLGLFVGYRPVSAQIVCDPADPAADCDGDGVPNGVDQCPNTVVGGDLVIGNITLTGFGDTILPTGCSLAESIAQTVQACSDNAKNHGQFVSCVTRNMNGLKKSKIITGKQKGQITSAAARSDLP